MKADAPVVEEEIPCAACKRGCRIADLTLYQTYWHVPPRGCCEGDYWKEGECQFVCPHCDTANRLLFETTWDTRLLDNVSRKNNLFERCYRCNFKEVVDVYDREEKPSHKGKWTNNYWIDGLPEK